MASTRKVGAKAKQLRKTSQATRLTPSAKVRRVATRRSQPRSSAPERQLQAELDLLHAVQQALAQKLEYQAIVDLVGDKIGEIFDAQMVTIGRYDHERGLVDYGYFVQKGRRVRSDPAPFAGMSRHMIESRRTLVINENYGQTIEDMGSTWIEGMEVPLSAAYVPLLVGEVVTGVIVLGNLDRENAFGESDVRLLETLASSMSVALENARLFDEVQRRNQEISEALAQQTATNEVLRALSGSQTDLKSLLETIAEHAAKVCGADDAHIYRVEGETLKEWTHRGPIPGLEAGESLPLNRQSMIGRAIVDRETLHVADAAVDLDEAEYPVSVALRRRWGYHTAVSTPLLRDGKSIGGIAIRRKEIKPFTEKEIAQLKTFADQAVIAIENTRLFEETRELLKQTEQRAAELAIINSVQEGLASKLEMQAIYDLVGDKIREIFSADVVGITLYDRGQNLVRRPYIVDHGERFFPEAEQPSSFWAGMLQMRQALILHAFEELEALVAQFGSSLEKENYGGPTPDNSFVMVPLLVGGETTGNIIIGKLPAQAFNESDARLLSTLASSMSVALENARFFDETQRLLSETEHKAAELAIINSVQQGLASKLEMQAIYDLVGNQIGRIFDTQTVSIRFYERATNLIQYGYSTWRGKRLYLETEPLAPGLSQHVIQTRQTFLANTDVQRRLDEIGSKSLPGAQGEMGSLLAVPTISGNEATGLIVIGNADRENAYSESDVALLTTLANSMSVALENARLFDETQRLLKETEQRAAELAIINSVQEGLASKLDFNSIIDLVGEKIREIFEAQVIFIALYDAETETVSFPYTMGPLEGVMQRSHPAPAPVTGFSGQAIRTHRTVVVNEDMDRRSAEVDSEVLVGGIFPKSAVFVPLQSSGTVLGVISLQNMDREQAFSAADVRLLETLASSMSLALENARLLDEIQRQREYFESVVQQSPVAIVLVDPNQNVVSWNPAAERLFGYTSAEALGHNLDDLVAKTPEVRTDAELFTPRTYEGKMHHAITKRTRRDGTLVDVELLGEIIEIAGQVVGGVVLYHNITELEQARQEAIAANQAKSAFLANMSHELRTPLNAIIGFTRIVRRKGEEVLPQKQTENLDKVLASAEHLLGLINTVLDISKIEAGRMDVLPANFRIGALIDLCANTGQPLLKPGVLLEKQVDDGLNLIYSDQDKIRQIVLNLLANAAKFTSQGKVVLSARPEGTDRVRISVADTGIGIDRAVLPRIFEEFQQADNSTTREYGGTGLGLTISRNLAHLLGGELTAESEPGKGSTFALTIPIQFQPTATPQVAESSAASTAS